METEIGNDTLIAFLDGELPPRDTERVAKLLATRPDLDAWAQRQETLRGQLKGAFAEVMVGPTPERLVATIHTAPLSWRWRMRRWLDVFTPRALVPAGLTLAAGLMLGLYLRPSNDLILSGGQLVARGTFGAALDNKLASAGYDGTGPHIGISFHDRAGHDCRTFSSGTQAGLACHQDKGWVVGTLVSQPQESGTPYRMAGSEMPDAVRNAVSASIEGMPFDAAAEKAARDRGWK